MQTVLLVDHQLNADTRISYQASEYRQVLADVEMDDTQLTKHITSVLFTPENELNTSKINRLVLQFQTAVQSKWKWVFTNNNVINNHLSDGWTVKTIPVTMLIRVNVQIKSTVRCELYLLLVWHGIWALNATVDECTLQKIANKNTIQYSRFADWTFLISANELFRSTHSIVMSTMKDQSSQNKKLRVTMSWRCLLDSPKVQ